MAFPDDLEWNQPGVEPTQAKKDEGWKPEEKPPAEYFNWFFNRTSQAVKYLKGESDKLIDDAKIGNRTITDTVTAAAGAGTITNLLSKIGNMIKRITGKSNWYTAPAITLEEVSTQYWKPSMTYVFGVIIKSPILTHSNKYFECTTAGTSGTTEPTWGAVGTTVTDGTAVWTIRDVRDSRKLQTARTIAGVPFDGSENISLTPAQVGASASMISIPLTAGKWNLVMDGGAHTCFDFYYYKDISNGVLNVRGKFISSNANAGYVLTYDSFSWVTANDLQIKIVDTGSIKKVYFKPYSNSNIVINPNYTSCIIHITPSFDIADDDTSGIYYSLKGSGSYINGKQIATMDLVAPGGYGLGTNVTILTSGQENSTTIKTGHFYWPNTISGSPNGNAGFLDRRNNANSVITDTFRDLTTHTTHTRDNVGAAWSPWKQLATMDLVAPAGYGLGANAKNVATTDINTIIVTGWFAGWGDTKTPSPGAGYTLRVDSRNANYDHAIQEIAHDAIPNMRWTRSCTSGVWSSWKQIATTDLIPAGASAVKAHVNFSYEGGVITIRNSFNVSSVVRTSGGQYTINFATPLASANYTVQCTAANLGTGVRQGLVTSEYMSAANTYGTKTANAIAILTVTNNDSDTTVADVGSCNVTILQ